MFQKFCKLLMVAFMVAGLAFSAFNFFSVKADAQAVEYKEEKLIKIKMPGGLPPEHECKGEGLGCHTFTYPTPPGDPMPPQD